MHAEINCMSFFTCFAIIANGIKTVADSGRNPTT
jgi:hypothetical protein